MSTYFWRTGGFIRIFLDSWREICWDDLFSFQQAPRNAAETGQVLKQFYAYIGHWLIIVLLVLDAVSASLEGWVNPTDSVFSLFAWNLTSCWSTDMHTSGRNWYWMEKTDQAWATNAESFPHFVRGVYDIGPKQLRWMMCILYVNIIYNYCIDIYIYILYVQIQHIYHSPVYNHPRPPVSGLKHVETSRRCKVSLHSKCSEPRWRWTGWSCNKTSEETASDNLITL